MADVYVAAGSNIDAEKHLCLALEELEKTFGELTVSPAYRNQAVGFEGEDFINLVVGFQTDEPPRQVKHKLEAIETRCGRPPAAPKWASRTMDLDILLYDQQVSDEPGLLLPRPDLLRRAFMLKPLADIAPGLRHPTRQRTMQELWDEFAAGDHALAEVTIPRSARRRPPESAR